MKNILVILISGFFFGSCATKQVITPAANDEGNVIRFIKLPATNNGFSKGNNEIKGPVKKEEIEGAVVSVNGIFTITPSVEVDIESSHENGGILRYVEIIGNDPISFSDNSIFLVEKAFFKNEKSKSPDSLQVSVISPDSAKFCLSMVRTQKGNYIPKVIYKTVKRMVYSDSIKVYFTKNGKKRYIRLNKEGGGYMYIYKKNQLPSKYFDKNGKLLSQYKVQKLPIKIGEKENGDPIFKYSTKTIYEKDDAGFKFISPCGGVYYLSNKNIQLNSIWVKQEIDDRRQMIYSNGYKSPND